MLLIVSAVCHDIPLDDGRISIYHDLSVCSNDLIDTITVDVNVANK